MVDLLITHGLVLTMNPSNQVFEDGAVAIQGNQIVAVGATADLKAQYTAVKTIDARNKVVMPGLVDTYGHAGHGLIKGLYHPHLGWPAGSLYFHATDDDWWYAEGLLSGLERLKFGVTCGYTVVGATPPRMDHPIFAERQAQALGEIGVRGMLGVGPPDPYVSHLPEPWSGTLWRDGKPVNNPFTFRDALANTEWIIEKYHRQADDRIQVSIHYPYLFGRQAAHPRIPFKYHDGHVPLMLEKALEIRDLADRLDVLIHTHIFVGSIEFGLQKFGRSEVDTLLRTPVAFAHANGLKPVEIDLLGEKKAGICVVPYTHENLYYGPCPVIELLRAGANVSISTDGTAPYCSYDLFKDISRAIWTQWSRFNDQTLLPPGKALRMVTIDAARVLGLDHLIGSLEIGKCADLILVNFDQPHLVPTQAYPRLLAFYTNGNDVDTVIVDGKILMEQRQVRSVDEGAVLALAREQAQKAFERVDITPYLQMDDEFWQNPSYSPLRKL